MRRRSLTWLAAAMAVAACGGDDDELRTIDAAPGTADAAAADASPGGADARSPDAAVDAKPSTVVEADCGTATIAATVTTTNGVNAYSIDVDTTLPLNSVVRFRMSSSHNAISGPAGQPDGAFTAPFGETTCFRFTEAGTFPFYCGPHRFTAQVRIAGGL
jgi:plastocyanin